MAFQYESEKVGTFSVKKNRPHCLLLNVAPHPNLMLQPQTDPGGSYTLIPTHRHGAPCQCRLCRCPIIPGLSSTSSAIRPNCNTPPAVSPTQDGGTLWPLKRICLLRLMCLCAYFQFLLVNEIMLPLLTLHLVYMIYSHLL